MQTLWCWRCQAEVPMLDEEEFAVINQLYKAALQNTKAYREHHRTSFADTPVAELYRPVREAYSRMTGAGEFRQDAILYHRISRYGPPCRVCGKPLRAPLAQMCAACGATREE